MHLILPARMRFVPLFALALAACAEGSTTPPVTREVHGMLFIGNSITLHEPAPSLGWSGSWGMAASAATTDYAHRLASRFPSASAVILNVSAFETTYRTYDLSTLDAELAKEPDVVVVELGDNVQDPSGFPAAYDALIGRVAAHSGTLVLCASTWWGSEVVNAAIRTACSRANTRYVDISGLRRDPSTWAASERSYADAGVGQHPGDRGMQLIANALYDALR